MKRSLISLSLLLGFALVLAYGCKKDDDDGNIVDHSNMITSIDAQIIRITDNGQGGVNIFMNVTDQSGNAIKNLDETNFDIFQVSNSGVATPVNGNGSGPPSMILTALTMDYSGSMYADSTAIPSMENAIASFLSLKDPTDQAELIKFSTNVEVTVPLTHNDNALMAGLSTPYADAGGATALYRSIIQGQTDVANGLTGNPFHLPSVVAFTDGNNNQSPHDIDSILFWSAINQIPVYTVGFGYQPDTLILKEIADSTGGHFFWSPNTTNLNNLYQMVSGQLSSTTIVTVTGPGTKGKIMYRVTAKVNTPYGYFEDTDEKYFYY